MKLLVFLLSSTAIVLFALAEVHCYMLLKTSIETLVLFLVLSALLVDF